MLLELDATSMTTPDSMSLLMDRLQVTVTYESLYEEPFRASYPVSEGR